MRLALSCALLASALLCLSACNKAESPEKVQADVAKAQSNAAEENAKADAKVKQVEADAAKDRADAFAASWIGLRLFAKSGIAGAHTHARHPWSHPRSRERCFVSLRRADPTTSGCRCFWGYRNQAEIRKSLNCRGFLHDFGSVPGSQYNQ
jgi:hypothetical protein